MATSKLQKGTSFFCRDPEDFSQPPGDLCRWVPFFVF
jgi:hypothetical protein